jgi:diguanylate cyclase (GGDEF)-like protein/PAS domain S-box-containing protein
MKIKKMEVKSMGERTPTLYGDILKQLSVGVLIINEKGVIQFANHAYSEMSGFEMNEVLGKQVDSYLESTFHMDEDWQGEVYVKRKGKKDFLQWLYASPVKESNGNNLYTVLLIRDFHINGLDPLTKLPNRSLLSYHLSKSVKKAQEECRNLAVLFIDLDRFKFVNDTLGHAYGDLLLNAAANRIKSTIGEKNFIVRMGGDEFVCILEDLQSEAKAESYAQAIVKSFSRPFQLHDTEVFVTVSIGISIFPYDGDEEELLLSNADAAMYKAKKKGRNQYEKVKINESAGAYEKFILENSLRKALVNDELTLYFQPQINIKTDKMNSMEALIRWNHPKLGLISPGDFIPIAEESGLILLIDDWVLRNACMKIKEWLHSGLPPVRVAINLSAAQFLQKNNLVEKIESVLAETSLDPSFLELEITENMVMHDIDGAIKVLTKLKERGIHLAIDDFGTGYSSLQYLKELPVDTIKIDRSFIKDVNTNIQSASLTKAIITLAHDFHLHVVAEGVENVQQLSLVKQQSCDTVQGFYFSKPLNDEQMIQYLTTNDYVRKVGADQYGEREICS